MQSKTFGSLSLAVSAVFLLSACTTAPVNSTIVDYKKTYSPPSGSTLSGDYTLIAVRRASNVAGGVDDATFSNTAIGSTISLNETLTWLDGKECARWRTSQLATPAVNLNDPNLVDLIIGEDGGILNTDDKSKLLHFNIICDGASLGAFTRLDNRILVTSSSSGLTYLIFERPLSLQEIEILQRQLKDMKFYDGEMTGKMDEATIDAVSRYASYRGRYDLTFHRSAITENLMNGLNVLSLNESCCAGSTTSMGTRYPDYKPKLSEDTVLDYRPGLSMRLSEIPEVTRQDFQVAYVTLGDYKRDAILNPGRMERGNVALGADPDEYVPSDEELLAAELGDQLAALVRTMTAEQIMNAWDGAALVPASTDYYRFEYRHVDVMGSGRFFYASTPLKTVIDIPPKPKKQ